MICIQSKSDVNELHQYRLIRRIHRLWTLYDIAIWKCVYPKEDDAYDNAITSKRILHHWWERHCNTIITVGNSYMFCHHVKYFAFSMCYNTSLLGGVPWFRLNQEHNNGFISSLHSKTEGNYLVSWITFKITVTFNAFIKLLHPNEIIYPRSDINAGLDNLWR